ncbi:MAG: ABC transporter substrate-binding protein [Betaproteobacteria bacterium]|nr:ABC transporter substrate-binding protein [Betaproteobacteria bacterium]
MRNTSLMLAALAAVALALPATSHAQNTTLTVGMPTTPPNIVHMPVIVAQELGLFKKNGIEVKTIALAGGVKVFRAMLAGNLDIAQSPGTVTSIAISKGSKVKAILGTLYKFEASMVVRGDIKTMADLKGKRIGIQQPGGFADILSKSVLRHAKVNPKDVNFVSIATEDVPALVADQVDTAILHVEQEMLAKEKVPSLHAIARMWELQPKQMYTFYAVKDETIKAKPAALQAFVTSVIEATRIMYSDKAKVLPIMVKHTGYPEKIVSDSYDLLVKSCIWDANTGLSPERVNFTANLMTKVGNIEKGKTPSYDQIVDKTFAENAIKKLGEWKGSVCQTAVF